MQIDPSDTTALRLLGNATDVARCVAIYRSPIAAQRPVAAWQLLPLGHSPGETIAVLAGTEIEPDTAEIYSTHLAVLEARSGAATAEWLNYSKGHGDGRYETHYAH